MTDRLELALQLSDDILTGIEMETISLSAAALRCLRLARLMSDDTAIEWLQYETTGYPMKEGLILTKAFGIACAHGRELSPTEDSKRQVFAQLADELEAKVEAQMASLANFKLEGVSLAGDALVLATRELTASVISSTASLINAAEESKHKLAILRGQYYSYAISVNLELKFSRQAEEVFQSYRLSVDNELIDLAPDSLKKLDAAYECLSSTNPESWSQALTSCRRVFKELSDALFTVCFAETRNKIYTTQSGKTLNVSGDNYLNRLFAVVDSLGISKTNRRLIGSELMHVVDWIENLHDSLCRGIHEMEGSLTYEDARTGILQTYMLLGDITILLSSANREEGAA